MRAESPEALKRYPWPGKFPEMRDAVEYAVIPSKRRTFELTVGNKALAARMLGLSVRSLYRRLERYAANDLAACLKGYLAQRALVQKCRGSSCGRDWEENDP